MKAMHELKRHRRPSPPGLILRAHYLEPRGVSITALATALDLSRKHTSQVVNGHKPIDPRIAAKLARLFDTTTRFWLNLQAAVDDWDATTELADWQPTVTFARPAPTAA